MGAVQHADALLLTAEEAAALLGGGMTVERLYVAAREGVVPSVKIGRQVRFSRAALVEWINRGGTPLEGGWRHSST